MVKAFAPSSRVTRSANTKDKSDKIIMMADPPTAPQNKPTWILVLCLSGWQPITFRRAADNLILGMCIVEGLLWSKGVNLSSRLYSENLICSCFVYSFQITGNSTRHNTGLTRDSIILRIWKGIRGLIVTLWL